MDHIISSFFTIAEPWMHVFLFTVGAWAGNMYTNVEKQLVEDINKTRAASGLSPVIGTKGWIRYAPEKE
jgi:hypothetical protein